MAVGVAVTMRQVRNYFERDCFQGPLGIMDGTLTACPDAPFVAVEGVGVFAQGEIPDTVGTDQVRFWTLYPPADFLALCEEISAYDEQHPVGAPRSESFGAYRYSGGAAGGWEVAFAARLAPYRRMFTEVKV